MAEKIIVNKESFGFGEIAEEFASAPRSKPFQGGCHELTNAIISQKGTAVRRTGSKHLTELTSTGTVASFSYRSPTDKNYLILIEEGQMLPKIVNLEDYSEKTLGEAIEPASEREQTAPQSYIDYRKRFDNSLTDQQAREQYAQELLDSQSPVLDINDPFKLENTTYTEKIVSEIQFAYKENLICFTCNDLPPFFIIEDEDENFLLARSLMQLSEYYNPRQTNLLNRKDSDIYFQRLWQSYPMVFLPFGFGIEQSNASFNRDKSKLPLIRTSYRITLYDNLRLFPDEIDFSSVAGLTNTKDASFLENKLLIAIDLNLDKDGVPQIAIKNKYNYISIGTSKGQTVVSLAPSPTAGFDISNRVRGYQFGTLAGDNNALLYRFRDEAIDIPDGDNSTFWGGISSEGFLNSPTDLRPSPTSLYIHEWDQGDYPKTCAFYERRLILGNTRKSPQKIWFSEINAESKFFDADITIGGLKPITPSSPGSYELASNRSFDIKRINSLDGMFILTDDLMFSSRGTDASISVPFGTGFTPNFSQPASELEMQPSDNYMFFFSEDRQKLYRIFFSRQVQKFVREDMTVFVSNLRKRALELGDTEEHLGFRAGGFDSTNKINVFQYGRYLFCAFTMEEQTETQGWSMNFFQGIDGPKEILDITPYQREKVRFLFITKDIADNVALEEIDFTPISRNTFQDAMGDDLLPYLDSYREFTREENETDEAFFTRINMSLSEDFTYEFTSGGLYLGEFDNSETGSARTTRKLEGFNKVSVGVPYKTTIAPITPTSNTRRGNTLRATKKFSKVSLDIPIGGAFRLMDSRGNKIGRDTSLVTIIDDNYVTLGTDRTITQTVAMSLKKSGFIKIETDSPYPLEVSGVSYEGDIEE